MVGYRGNLLVRVCSFQRAQSWIIELKMRIAISAIVGNNTRKATRILTDAILTTFFTIVFSAVARPGSD